MARHRSPQGRRPHLGFPLPSLAAAAGTGGGASATSSGVALTPRVILTVVAGGAVAAAGQAALTEALPLAADGTNILKLGVQEMIGDPAATAPPLDLGPVVATVAAGTPAPRPVDVAELVKATELHRQAAQAAAPAPGSQVDATRASAPVRPSVADAPAPPKPRVPEVLKPPAPRTAPDVARPPTPRAAPDARPPVARKPEAAAARGPVRLVAGRVTSGFGARWGGQHRGLDIAAPIGTPIHAPLAGEVIASGPASGFGLWVRVRHDDGTVTTYGHVNRSHVRVGEKVTAGQRIAEVGNRGQSTGPHLHIEVDTPSGTKIDPRGWLGRLGIEY